MSTNPFLNTRVEFHILQSFPVTCLNHGTSEVVEAILDFLKRKARSGEKTAMRKLVRPQLYLNKTIGEINLPLP